MRMQLGLQADNNPEVLYIHSVSGGSTFKLDFGIIEIKMTSKEAEYLLLARETILMREHSTMKGRAQ